MVLDLSLSNSLSLSLHISLLPLSLSLSLLSLPLPPSLLVTHLKVEGHADISHNELVLLQVNTKLDKGELDARGGVIAGTVLIQNIQANGKTAIKHYVAMATGDE